MTIRVLILGGTTEARLFAARLAERSDIDATMSLAGRTANPVTQPVPVRTGGFGGAAGLASWLEDHGADMLVDATHPYAAQMSDNAALAAHIAGVPVMAIRRPAWEPGEGDNWIMATDVSDAIAMLGLAPRNVFVALGRNELGPLTTAPQHHYTIRSVDPVEPPLDLPNAEYILDRGPFAIAAETALLRSRGIAFIVAKNSGGEAAAAKLAAARELGITILMIDRPLKPPVPAVHNVESAVALFDHLAASGMERGV